MGTKGIRFAAYSPLYSFALEKSKIPRYVALKSKIFLVIYTSLLQQFSSKSGTEKSSWGRRQKLDVPQQTEKRCIIIAFNTAIINY